MVSLKTVLKILKLVNVAMLILRAPMIRKSYCDVYAGSVDPF